MFEEHCSTVRVNDKVVGQVVEGRFVKRVRASKHMLKTPPGWGFDVQSLESARLLGAETVEVEDSESGTVYSASLSRIHQKGFRFDRGYGPQICLPLQFWSVRRPGEPQQMTLALGVMS